MKRIKVLALASYPREIAATRYRVEQYGPRLKAVGVDVELSPFLSSDLVEVLYEPGHRLKLAAGLSFAFIKRFLMLVKAARADVVLIQREAALFGPPVFEWIISKVLGKPILLDLDDATFVPYVSPTYGPLASRLKWFGKTDQLIRWADMVIAGNRVVAEYVSQRAKPTVILPTVVDTSVFTPRSSGSDPPVIGWVGSHSTFPYLKSLLPVIEELGQRYRFKLKVVGGTEEVRLRTVEVENVRWQLAREVEDFRSLDLGLYPIIADEWSIGKSGFKAIQYMAVGIPTVASAVGAVNEILEDGVTGFLVSTPEEWRDRLSLLLENAELRRRMGQRARDTAVRRFSLDAQAEELRRGIVSVMRRRTSSG